MQRYTDDNSDQLDGDAIDQVVEALVIIFIVLLILGALAWMA